MKKEHSILLIFILLSIASYAQVRDTIKLLNEVKVQAGRLTSPAASVRVQQLDTNEFTKIATLTIADQLNREAGLFVKSYGSGGLATVTIQGTNATHTSLLWNGIRINNPMLGLSDLSLIPSFLIDNTTVQFGGTGSIQGNGAIGGAIHMESMPSSQNGIGIKLLSGVSSFGGYQNGVSLNTHNGNLLTKTRVFNQYARNNFKYSSISGEQKELANAALKQTGITNDIKFGKDNNYFEFHTWYLVNSYQIPPGMLTAISKQRQDDNDFRVAALWHLDFNKLEINIHSGFTNDRIRFTDPQALIDEKSNATSIQVDCEVKNIITSQWKIISRITGDHAYARIDSYKNTANLDQLYASSRLQFSHSKLFAEAGIRIGSANGKLLPILPSSGIIYKISNAFSFKGELALVYKIPTLNDRFWIPGGNLDLLPEQGRNISSFISFNKKKGKISIHLEGGFFDLLIDNVIVWIPQTGGYYGAENVQQIHSNGISGLVETIYKNKDFSCRFQFSPQWNNAIITKSNALSIFPIDKQLVYTPRILYKGNLGVSYKNISFQYYFNYSGYRFTTTDNNSWLEPYSISDINASYTLRLKKFNTTFVVGARNILNEEYQVIAWRAMPRINYQAGIIIDFSKSE